MQPHIGQTSKLARAVSATCFGARQSAFATCGRGSGAANDGRCPSLVDFALSGLMGLVSASCRGGSAVGVLGRRIGFPSKIICTICGGTEYNMLAMEMVVLMLSV